MEDFWRMIWEGNIKNKNKNKSNKSLVSVDIVDNMYCIHKKKLPNNYCRQLNLQHGDLNIVRLL